MRRRLSGTSATGSAEPPPARQAPNLVAPICDDAVVSLLPETPAGRRSARNRTLSKELLVHGEPRPSPPTVRPAIFIASLTDHVNGIIHGQWVQARAPVAVLQSALKAILASSPWAERTGEPAEEWIILDHEGFGVSPHPHEAFPDVATVAGWPGDNEGSQW